MQSQVVPVFEPESEPKERASGGKPTGPAIQALFLVWEQRRVLWRAAVVGLVAGVIIALLIPRSYESTTLLMPPDNQAGSSLAMLAAMAGTAGSRLGSVAGDLMGVKSSGALFVSVLQSRTVQDRIIARFDLRKVYGYRYWEDARRKLARNTLISEDRKSGVIGITVTDHDPSRAAQIAHAYVEELDRLVSDVSTSSARRERIFIEQRMSSVKQDLTNAEQQFSQFASKNTALDIKEQTKAMVESAAVLQGQLMAAQSELQGLEQIYSAGNVRVRSLRARIEELERQLRKLGGADASLVSDSAPSGDLYPSIRKLPLLGVEWADLYRRMKIQETVFELLNQQYELARIQEAKEIPVVSVIDPANVPERKAFPPRTLIMLLAMLLFVLGGVAWILGSNRWQQLDPQDSRKVLAETVWKSASEQGRYVASRFSRNGSRASLIRGPKEEEER